MKLHMVNYLHTVFPLKMIRKTKEEGLISETAMENKQNQVCC